MKASTFFVASLLIPISMLCPYLPAQVTEADYQRSNQLEQLWENKVFPLKVEPNWLESNRHFWYRSQVGLNQHEFVIVDIQAGKRRVAFDHSQLAAALSAQLEQAIDPKKLPIRRLEFSNNLDHVNFVANRKQWKWEDSATILSPVGQSKKEVSTVRVLKKAKPSVRTGSETSLCFVNAFDEAANIYWIDSTGSHVPYGSVLPWEERDQNTYAGHVWVAKDSNQKILGVFQAVESAGIAVIDAMRKGKWDGEDSRRTKRNASQESPDGLWKVIVRDNNICLINLGEQTEVQLSFDGTEGDSYQDDIYWSPDSTKIITIKQQEGDNRKVHFVESAPEGQLQPKLHSFYYDKPGDKLPKPKPVLFDVTSKMKIDLDPYLFPNPWSITEFRWHSDSERFTFLYNQRGHQQLRVIEVNASTGESKVVIEESTKTFCDYSNKTFLQHVDQSNELIWMSERDGWNHLYLYDSQLGKVKNQITKGDWVVRKVKRIDLDKRQIWFLAGGVYSDQDPYYLHLCLVNFDGTGFRVLTKANGTHEIKFSPDGDYFIDTYSRVDLPPNMELRHSLDGRMVCDLETSDLSELEEAGWKSPEQFVAKGRDGKTDIYGVIYRPTNFDSKKKYPVIEKIYAGPHGAFVPKKFQAYRDTQALAELGFIVVQIDGMGTSHRSKQFHDVCWKNLGDSGFPDRILWMQAAAKVYPEMDLDKVGIYGGSAGGQSALCALLTYGDFYDVAVSDCGCHDNRMDKVWWNEQWMGWPIGPHYEEQSNVTQAYKLQGKLLLTVGELDRNVDPASTMQVVKALIDANKDFDLIVFPGAGHGAGSSAYGKRRRNEFFIEHLY